MPDLAPDRHYTRAIDINSDGKIVGYSAYDSTYGATGDLCYWNATGATFLGSNVPLNGMVGINEHGDIAGSMSRWIGGTKSYLPTLTTPGANALYNINNSGEIIGVSAYNLTTGATHACMWDSTGIHDLDMAAGSKPYGINDHQQIVGESGGRAFIWENGTAKDLGTLPGYDRCTARRINNKGQVIGASIDQYNLVDRYEGFIWQNGNWIDLGATHRSTLPMDINDVGQVVGYSWDISNPLRRTAFLWENGTMTALTGLGNDVMAFGINENGWIVGQSLASDGYYHAVVWEPVPEPSCFLALLCGLVGVSVRKIKRSA